MKKKILVIDDEEILIKTMNRLLEKQGYEVYTAKSGQDAEVLAEVEHFDAIISDIRIPGRNGVEIVKSIQKQTQRNIPVIFITGFADVKLEREAKALKPAGYFLKPFDLQEFIRAIKEILDQ